LGNLFSLKANLATRRLPKARHHIEQGAFATARVTNDADKFPLTDGEIHLI